MENIVDKVRKNAVIVDLSISSWKGRKRDKNISEKISYDFQSKIRGTYVKKLIDDEIFLNIMNAENRIRHYNYIMTLPWGERGVRMLPLHVYEQYLETINSLIEEWKEAVKVFIENYDVLIEDARDKLGMMFNPDDYPSKNSIQNYFDIKLSIMPIPSDDIRIAITEDQIDSLRQHMHETIVSYFRDGVITILEECIGIIKDTIEKIDSTKVTTRLLGSVTRMLASLTNISTITGSDIDITPSIEALSRICSYKIELLKISREECEKLKDTCKASINIINENIKQLK